MITRLSEMLRYSLEYLQEGTVDLVFLDIKMPKLSGFELLVKLDKESLPRVIFSTAYDRYALRAFEVNAVDYLLKPYTKDRFDEALDRILQKEESKEQERAVLVLLPLGK